MTVHFSRATEMTRRNVMVAGLCVIAALAAPAVAYESVLYEKQSAYSTVVVTDEGGGLRALRFGRDGVRQSLVKLGDPEYLALPYARTVMTGLALCDEPRRILVVGLGGGTLPAFLRKRYPEAEIDAVEIDPEVVYVAKQYLGFREDARMRVHVADGRKFIEDVARPYDAIFLDAFGSDAVPPHLTTREFLGAVRRAVAPGGVVIGNVWARESNRLYDSMVRTYRDVFDELFVVRASGSGNRILLALPRKEALTREEIVRRARVVSESKGFTFDLGTLFEDGYTPADGDGSAGRVLLDADLKGRD